VNCALATVSAETRVSVSGSVTAVFTCF